MEIKENYPLKEHNTLGVDAICRLWVRYDSLADLEALSRDELYQESRTFFIGEGSNLLFLSHFNGIILSSGITSLEEISRGEDYVVLRVGSGLVWDDFVAYAVKQGYHGAENLSLIPGTVGAAAVQNIGAYGSDVAQLITSVDVFDMRDGKKRTYEADACEYGYRESIFKTKEHKHEVITHVTIRLGLTPAYNLTYSDLKRRFEEAPPKSLAEVRQAVIDIRESKLPDPKQIGSAGSFFKNPIVTSQKLKALLIQYPQLSYHMLPNGEAKLSAAWLIDNAGLKGYRMDAVGVYEKQPLVLANYGGATGREIAALAEYVCQTVHELYDIELSPEVLYV